MRTLLVLAILIPGLITALFSRFASLLLYVWFALFRPQEFVYFDLSSLRLSLAVGILAVVPNLALGIWPNLTHPVSICTIGFVLSGVLAHLGAANSALSWEWTDYMLRLGLICLFVSALTTTRARFLLLMGVTAGSFGFHTAKAGLNSLFGGGVRYSEGLAGAFIDNNGYALGIVMILPLLLAVSQNQRRPWNRVAFLLSVPLSAFAAISTFSRGGFLGLLACAAALIVLQKRRGVAATVVVSGALAGVLLMPVPEGYSDRMMSIKTYEEIGDRSAMSRLHFWRVALDIAWDRPLGVGLRNFEAVYDAYDTTHGLYGRNRSVHNSHLQVLAEAGFGGALAYLGVCFFAFRSALRARRRSQDERLEADDRRFLETSSNALVASLVGFMVSGSFIALALNDLFWLVAAMAMALDLISKQLVEQAVPAGDPSRDPDGATVPSVRVAQWRAPHRGGRPITVPLTPHAMAGAIPAGAPERRP